MLSAKLTYRYYLKHIAIFCGFFKQFNFKETNLMVQKKNVRNESLYMHKERDGLYYPTKKILLSYQINFCNAFHIETKDQEQRMKIRLQWPAMCSIL